MSLLEGRKALVFGVANRRSIAWAISQALAREGAELAFTYQGERLEQGVRDLAATVNSPLVVPADVTRDEDLDAVFDADVLMLMVIVLVRLGKPDRRITLLEERNVIAAAQVAVAPVDHPDAGIEKVVPGDGFDVARQLP